MGVRDIIMQRQCGGNPPEFEPLRPTLGLAEHRPGTSTADNSTGGVTNRSLAVEHEDSTIAGHVP